MPDGYRAGIGGATPGTGMVRQRRRPARQREIPPGRLRDS